MTTVEKLNNAAERALEAHATLSNAYPVVETFKGQIVWEGAVSEFTDEQGRIAFVWMTREGGETRYIAVLKEPPIASPLDAVRVWLVSQARK